MLNKSIVSLLVQHAASRSTQWISDASHNAFPPNDRTSTQIFYTVVSFHIHYHLLKEEVCTKTKVLMASPRRRGASLVLG